MKRSLLLAVIVLGLISSAAYSHYRRVGAGEGMTAEATAFLTTLSDEQKKVALLEYDSPARVDWHFIPKPKRKGLQIREMNPGQRKAAHSLLKAALSETGYGKAMQIMEMENLLAELEKTKKGTPLRDAERYYFTVFGKPAADGKWALSVEGHHLSLNYVIENGAVVSSTPATYAANPALVMSDVIPSVAKGTRILKQEELLAFELLASLTPEQRKAAVIAEKAPAEIRAAGEAQPPTAAPEGVSADKLSPEQQAILRKLLAEYAASMPADVAEGRLGAIEKAGLGAVHFAWAGAEKPGIGHYYKIQGKTFLIEFVNTQPDAAGNPANHIHCIWRDMAGDFGIPLK